MKSLLALPILLAVVAFGSACGGDDDDDGVPTGTETPAASTPAVTSPAATLTEEPTPCPTTPPASGTASPSPEPTDAFQGGRDPVEKEGTNPVPPVAVMYDVRFGCHGTFDRIVFDFRDNLPGYKVEYVEPPITRDGSGEPLEIDGEAFLYVRFHVAQAHDDAGNPTYTGPSEIKPGLDSASEIQAAGDFEGYLTFGIGLPQELDFRVIDLADPYRVVIDIAHPE